MWSHAGSSSFILNRSEKLHCQQGSGHPVARRSADMIICLAVIYHIKGLGFMRIPRDVRQRRLFGDPLLRLVVNIPPNECSLFHAGSKERVNCQSQIGTKGGEESVGGAMENNAEKEEGWTHTTSDSTRASQSAGLPQGDGCEIGGSRRFRYGTDRTTFV